MQAAQGVGAGAGARRGREGGYEEGARHIYRALGGDGLTSFVLRASRWLHTGGPSCFLVKRATGA